MLQWIRDKLQGLVIRIFAVIIILIFVLGAGSYYLFNRNSYNKVAATVDGKDISNDVIDNIYHNNIKQYYSKQKSYDKLDLDPKKIKHQILLDMVNRTAIINGIKKSGFSITDEQLIGFVKNEHNFQNNGKFSAEKYNNFLQQISLTDSQYQQSLREYLLLEQLRNNMILSSFVPMPEVTNFIAKWHQIRNFGYVIIPFKKFIPPTIDDKSIEDYYQKNKKSLMIPETVTISYLDVTADKLIDRTPIDRNKLYNYYQEHTEYYTLPELVNVSHILITAPKGSHPDKINAAKDKIEDIFAKVKLGQDFNKLATQYSEDENSAKNGGNLGWLGKGEIDADFEQAAFSLTKNKNISEIVQSNFGYHIIKLLDKRASQVNDFDKVIDQVAKHYKEEEVQTKLQDLSDQLSNPTFANEDMATIANKFNLTIQAAGPFTTHGASSGIASYSEVVIAAFDEQNLHKNSDIIKLSEDHFVVLRVTGKQSAREKTFLEAHDEIKYILENIQAKQHAKNIGLDLATKILSSTTSPNKLAKSYDVDWNLIKSKRDDKSINAEILQAVFSLGKPNMQKNFSLANGDFVVVQLLNIQDADVQKILADQAETKEQIQQQLIYLQAYLEEKLYEQELLNAAKIKFAANIE